MSILKTRDVQASNPAPYFDVEPDNGKPPLLMLHGFLMSGAIWNDNIRPLGDIARCIRMELFGHNRSPTPEDRASYEPEHYFECLEALRQDLGYDSWSICAHSLGAALGLSYALAHPSSVNAVIFTNSRSALIEPDDAKAHARPSDFETKLVEAGPDGISQLRAHPTQMRYVPPHIRDALIHDSRLHDPRGIARTILLTAPKLNVRKRFHTLQCPVLLVNGVRERRFQPMKQWASETLPTLQVVDLDGGHSVNAEAADAFNTVVCEFLGNPP